MPSQSEPVILPAATATAGAAAVLQLISLAWNGTKDGASGFHAASLSLSLFPHTSSCGKRRRTETAVKEEEKGKRNRERERERERVQCARRLIDLQNMAACVSLLRTAATFSAR